MYIYMCVCVNCFAICYICFHPFNILRYVLWSIQKCCIYINWICLRDILQENPTVHGKITLFSVDFPINRSTYIHTPYVLYINVIISYIVIYIFYIIIYIPMNIGLIAPIPQKKKNPWPSAMGPPTALCGSTSMARFLRSHEIQELHKFQYSLDWFKGKSTGNHGFYHQI